MATRVRGSIPLKVLFIGNSFTARNDVPGLIAQLAAVRGKNLSRPSSRVLVVTRHLVTLTRSRPRRGWARRSRSSRRPSDVTLGSLRPWIKWRRTAARTPLRRHGQVRNQRLDVRRRCPGHPLLTMLLPGTSP